MTMVVKDMVTFESLILKIFNLKKPVNYYPMAHALNMIFVSTVLLMIELPPKENHLENVEIIIFFGVFFLLFSIARVHYKLADSINRGDINAYLQVGRYYYLLLKLIRIKEPKNYSPVFVMIFFIHVIVIILACNISEYRLRAYFAYFANIYFLFSVTRMHSMLMMEALLQKSGEKNKGHP